MACNLYTPNYGWIIKTILKLSAVAIIIGYLFYDSLLGMVFVIPFMIPVFAGEKNKYRSFVKAEIKQNFAEFLAFVSSNLGAGYSLENSFERALDECDGAYGDMLISEELRRIVNGRGCGKRLEDMLMDFGDSTEVEDIRNLSELIVMTKIYGGNLIGVIKMAAMNYRQNLLMEQELLTTISSKKLEGRIMLAAPFFIVVYMRLTNGQYMDMLYSTTLGRIVMTIGLLIIMVAWMLTDKIVRIEV